VPRAQWKLMVALSRYGGLRCPSETLSLKWADVDWERNLIRIPSPKTEHHDGKDCRLIPLFPELRPYVLDAFEQAEPGSEWDLRVRDRAHLPGVPLEEGRESAVPVNALFQECLVRVHTVIASTHAG
jgi:integrase